MILLEFLNNITKNPLQLTCKSIVLLPKLYAFTLQYDAIRVYVTSYANKHKFPGQFFRYLFTCGYCLLCVFIPPLNVCSIVWSWRKQQLNCLYLLHLYSVSQRKSVGYYNERVIIIHTLLYFHKTGTLIDLQNESCSTVIMKHIYDYLRRSLTFNIIY